MLQVVTFAAVGQYGVLGGAFSEEGGGGGGALDGGVDSKEQSGFSPERTQGYEKGTSTSTVTVTSSSIPTDTMDEKPTRTRRRKGRAWSDSQKRIE